MKFCCICGLEQKYISTEKVLKKYDVQYFQCTNCGLIQTEDPYWISEAYSDAIVAMDTGIIIRNISIAIRLTALLYVKFSNLKIGLDLAGGYGILTRLMRDFGYDFYWSDKFCENIVAKGFGINSIMTDKSIEVLTAFEVIEHLDNGLEIVKLLQKHCKVLLITCPWNEPKGFWGEHHKLHGINESHFQGFDISYIGEHGKITSYPQPINEYNRFNLMIAKWDKAAQRKEILCSVATRGRYTTTLPMVLMAIANQTKTPDKLVIFDDNDNPEDMRENPIYQHIFQILDYKKIA